MIFKCTIRVCLCNVVNEETRVFSSMETMFRRGLEGFLAIKDSERSSDKEEFWMRTIIILWRMENGVRVWFLCDGAIDKNFEKIDMSCIAYSSSNNILQECCKCSDGDSPLLTEAVGIALSCGWKNVCFYSESKLVIDYIMTTSKQAVSYEIYAPRDDWSLQINFLFRQSVDLTINFLVGKSYYWWKFHSYSFRCKSLSIYLINKFFFSTKKGKKRNTRVFWA